MLFGIVIFLFAFVGFLLALLILIQKGSSSMGIGSMGGKNVMLFGSSGGQDMFQKATWVLGALFMAGSLALSVIKTNQERGARYLGHYKNILPTQTQRAPAQPAQQSPAPSPQEPAPSAPPQ